MKKQGFTLIELMVVVVIIGILAAVAVPKLFGMIAKSKASEVGPAAGTYVKLQDAYVAESGIYVGNWTTIGYNMPGSNNFTYAQGQTTAQTVALAGLRAQTGWTATNKAKLNDCAASSVWQITIAEADNGNASKGSPIAYNATTPSATNNAGDCAALTPNFTKIGQ